MSAGRGVSLTGRQRDYLASYPSEVVVDIVGGEDGEVHVYANGEIDSDWREATIPPEGFAEQPTVLLGDPSPPEEGTP